MALVTSTTRSTDCRSQRKAWTRSRRDTHDLAPAKRIPRPTHDSKRDRHSRTAVGSLMGEVSRGRTENTRASNHEWAITGVSNSPSWHNRCLRGCLPAPLIGESNRRLKSTGKWCFARGRAMTSPLSILPTRSRDPALAFSLCDSAEAEQVIAKWRIRWTSETVPIGRSLRRQTTR